jgi:phenylacetate-CoA ligase
MLIIRGVNVFPTQVEERILAVPDLSPHYQMIVEREGNMDALSINVELKPEASGSADAAATALAQTVKEMVGVSAKVHVLEEGGVPRSAGKAQRVIDKR